MVTNEIEAGRKMILIYLLTSWQLQHGEKETQSCLIRLASGLLYLLRPSRKKVALIMKKGHLAPQPCISALWGSLLFGRLPQILGGAGRTKTSKTLFSF